MPTRLGVALTFVKRSLDMRLRFRFHHAFIVRMTELHTHPAMLMALARHYNQAKVDFNLPHFANYQHVKPVIDVKATFDRFNIELPMSFW